MFGVFLKQFIQDDLICDLIVVESQWLPNDSPLTLDPAKEMDFYIKAVDAGFITADEAAEALFGHPATGVKTTQNINPETTTNDTANDEQNNSNSGGGSVALKDVYLIAKAIECGMLSADDGAQLMFGHAATGERLNVPLSSGEGEAQ